MDARLKVMSEIINGIKVIKMHGWETAFAEKIRVLREWAHHLKAPETNRQASRNEIKSVGKSAIYSAIVMGIYFVSSKIGLVFYIWACFHFGQDLTTRGVFASVSQT